VQTGGHPARVRLLYITSGGPRLHPTVYRVMTLLANLVAPLPIGTNLALLHLLWMMLSGRLRHRRGAVIPGVSATGLPDAAVRRAWADLGGGAWSSAQLLEQWGKVVATEGQWQPHCYGGYHPVAIDITGFWRPRLVGCPTKHYDATAGKALPAIPLGIVARVGSAGGQRLGWPLALVRADPQDPSPRAHLRALVQRAVGLCQHDDVLVADREFGVAIFQEAKRPAWVVRLVKNFTARRASPPAYGGRGRPAERGTLVRPLARRYRGKEIAATPPDREESWEEPGRTIRTQVWTSLVLPDAGPDAPCFWVVAVQDPRYREPLLLATALAVTVAQMRDLAVSAAQVRGIYRDRWPVEQVPLAAKQMVGAERQYVHATERCQRLPELALVAGAVLSYAAATQGPVATGFWDRRPVRTPGRLQRVLEYRDFPSGMALPERVHVKAAVTAHLPKGHWGQQHPRQANAGVGTRPPQRNEAAPTPSVSGN
jgi:hypothetical protein